MAPLFWMLGFGFKPGTGRVRWGERGNVREHVQNQTRQKCLAGNFLCSSLQEWPSAELQEIEQQSAEPGILSATKPQMPGRKRSCPHPTSTHAAWLRTESASLFLTPDSSIIATLGRSHQPGPGKQNTLLLGKKLKKKKNQASGEDRATV